jgi:lambda repressor-like predicted transcriptional regulator
MALKTKGMGIWAISRELGMALSSVPSVLAGRKPKR